jgi:hypothetical protein
LLYHFGAAYLTHIIVLLQHRQKQNAQQHSRLEARRQLLQQRKEEVTVMDNRIHQLQEQLKKRRQQQQQQREQQQQNAQHAADPTKRYTPFAGQRKPSNIAAVEPFVQNVPREVSKDDLYSKQAFLKEDPKYQTLPANTKFGGDDGGNKHVIREVNNNTSGTAETGVDGVKPAEHKIPSLISSHFGGNRGRISSAGSVLSARGVMTQDNQLDKAPPTPPKHVAGDTGVSSKSEVQPPPVPRLADLGGSSSSTLASGATTPKGPRPFVKSGLPKWPPEPASKDKEEPAARPLVTPLQPQINIFDEERQAGSGQSSPASSEGSGPLVKQGSGVAPSQQQQVPAASLAHQASAPSASRVGHSLLHRQGPPPPPRMPHGTATVKPVSSSEGAQNAADSSAMSMNDSVSLGQPQATSTPNTSTATPGQGQDSVDGKAMTAVHLNQRPAPTYR